MDSLKIFPIVRNYKQGKELHPKNHTNIIYLPKPVELAAQGSLDFGTSRETQTIYEWNYKVNKF